MKLRGCVSFLFKTFRLNEIIAEVNHLLQQIIHFRAVSMENFSDLQMCGLGCKQLVKISSLEYLILDLHERA